MGVLGQAAEEIIQQSAQQGAAGAKALAQGGQEAVQQVAQARAAGAKALSEQGLVTQVAGAGQGGHIIKSASNSGSGGDDDVDFSQFVKPEGSESTAEGTGGTGTGAAPITGIKDLDERIKNRQLSMFDYYMAKNYLGINLGVHLNGSLDLNQKIANRTKAIGAVYKTLQALDLGENIIHKVQDNSGKMNGLMRWANHKTGGVIGLDPELAQMDSAINRYIYSVADATTSGKITNQAVNDARAGADVAFRSAQENTNRINEMQNIHLTRLGQQIAEVQALGGQVPMSVYLKLAQHKARVDYINSKGGKIDIKAYDKIGMIKGQ